MNGRDYSIKLNSLELGVLTGVIMQLDEIKSLEEENEKAF
ncbi:hypothetical protein ES708_03597 [subsurface metagenome]